VRFGAPWSPEQVLAAGGREALRREIGRLSRCALAAAEPVGAAAPVIDPITTAAPQLAGGVPPSSLSSAGGAPTAHRRQSS
jgi:hypothetical protein